MNEIEILAILLEKVESPDNKLIEPYQVIHIGDTANVLLSYTTHVSLSLSYFKADMTDAILNVDIYHKERGLLKKDEFHCLNTLGLKLNDSGATKMNQNIMKLLINNLSTIWR